MNDQIDTGRLPETHETLCDKVRNLTEKLEAKSRELAGKDRLPDRMQFEVGGLIDDVCRSVAPQLLTQNIKVELDLPGEISIDADRDMLHGAVLHLVLNAIDAMPNGGELFIGAWKLAGGVELEVSDSGSGISEEDAAKLFEPASSATSGGTSLGLAVVSRVVKAHGGAVRFNRCPEGGAAFTIAIPQRRLEAAA